ncbi:hypothetical protein E2C01_098188 [Portunus trituberculatus]|uniref:Uncharacterized protein n=1 Tax=Portunus trituberculatus TaxID=210409 RepID=A0A5B7KDE0_PORTR|nr:hypothetical protein [Portunus trituberculatus]
MVHPAYHYHLLFDPHPSRPSGKKHFYDRTHFGVPCVYGPYPTTFTLVVLTEEVKDIYRSCQHMRGTQHCLVLSTEIRVWNGAEMGSDSPFSRISPGVSQNATPG